MLFRSGGSSADAAELMHRRTTTVTALKVRMAKLVSHLLTQYKSELMLIILYNGERYSLAKSSATAAEGVYGMKRSRVVMERGGADSGGNNGGIRLAPLTQGDRVRCAIAAALLPYLREKLAALHLTQQQQYHQGPRDNPSASPSGSSSVGHPNQQLLDRIRHKLRTVVRTVYPFLSMTAEGASLVYQFGYLAGLTGYYSPSMHVLGVLTRRITRADLQQQQRRQQEQQQGGGQHVEQSRARSAAAQNGTNGEIAGTDHSGRGVESGSKSAVMSSLQSGKADHIVRSIRTAIIVGGTTLLVTGWVAHFREELRQRRRRWISGEDGTAGENGNVQQSRQPRQGARGHSNAATANRSIWTAQSNPIPPPHPPALLDESESDFIRRGLPTDTASCPICHRSRVNPAASTSGYVFCYRCLVMHLRSNGERCPLTGMHCPESRVIRLFEPTAAGSDAAAGISSNGRKGRDEIERADQGAGQSTGF